MLFEAFLGSLVSGQAQWLVSQQSRAANSNTAWYSEKGNYGGFLQECDSTKEPYAVNYSEIKLYYTLYKRKKNQKKLLQKH